MQFFNGGRQLRPFLSQDAGSGISGFGPKADGPAGNLTLAQLRKKVGEKYGEAPVFKLNLADAILSQLGRGASDLAFLKGKRFLELGCGSVLYDDSAPGRSSPWLCRCVRESGLLSEVVGVDLLPQEGEKFTAVQRDLSEMGALNPFKSSSFDFIVANNLLGFVGDIIGVADIGLSHRFTLFQLEVIKGELLSQINRLLVDGGLFCTNDGLSYALFQKQNGKLVKIE